MSFAKSLIDTHISSNQNTIEFEITEENKKQVLPLFKEFKQLGLYPEIEERNEFSFLVVNISSVSNKNSNVIDISLSQKNKKNQLIEVDFVSKKRK